MKKKLLKLLILTIIVSILVFTIYRLTNQDKINVTIIGDYLGVVDNNIKDSLNIDKYKNYSDKYETIDSLNTKINTTSSIKKDLRESELVIISAGLNDFYNHIRPTINTKNILDLKEEISLILPKLDKLLKDVRKYAKYDVMLIGYYNPVPFLFNTNSNELDVLFMYINSMVKDIVKKYNITYIQLYDLFKNNNYVTNDIYPNSKGYKAITKEIITKMIP